MRYYAADFETTNAIIKESGMLEVWLAGAVDIGSMTVANISTNITDFMHWMRHLDHDAVVYFHNLAHDGCYILDWLEREGFTYVENSKDLKRSKDYSCLISDGAWYDIVFNTVKLETGAAAHKVYVYDSLKRLPFSLDKLTHDFKVEHGKLTGTIDYNRHNVRCDITPDEMKYFEHDIFGLAEVIEKGILYNVPKDKDIRTRPKMTIGSECLADYKHRLNEFRPTTYGEYFPQLPAEVHDFCHAAYGGGWCYVNPRIKNIPVGAGVTVDVNSLYPSVMRDTRNFYPIGEAVEITEDSDRVWELMNLQQHEVKDGMPVVWFFEFEIRFKIKPEHLPCIQVHHMVEFNPREWLTDSHGMFIHMVRTEMDLKLIREQYDCCIYPIKAVGFKARTCLFNDYIDYWINIKQHPNSPSEKAIAKLHLNSLYGKFAAKTHGVRYVPTGFNEADRLNLTPVLDERKPAYMPVGAFITSYARCFTIRHAQANYENFCYADTDSLHLTCGEDEVKRCVIDDKALSCWKIESRWSAARFIRCKTYVEVTPDGNDLKCCGLMKSAQAAIAKGYTPDYLVEHIDEILSNVDGGKLLRKRMAGGVALVSSTFKMRGGNNNS